MFLREEEPTHPPNHPPNRAFPYPLDGAKKREEFLRRRKSLGEVKRAWKDIEAFASGLVWTLNTGGLLIGLYHIFLPTYPPTHLFHVHTGLSEEEVGRWEERMGCPLPPDLRASFLIHNGQGFHANPGLVGGGYVPTHPPTHPPIPLIHSPTYSSLFIPPSNLSNSSTHPPTHPPSRLLTLQEIAAEVRRQEKEEEKQLEERGGEGGGKSSTPPTHLLINHSFVYLT